MPEPLPVNDVDGQPFILMRVSPIIGDDRGQYEFLAAVRTAPEGETERLIWRCPDWSAGHSMFLSYVADLTSKSGTNERQRSTLTVMPPAVPRTGEAPATDLITMTRLEYDSLCWRLSQSGLEAKRDVEKLALHIRENYTLELQAREPQHLHGTAVDAVIYYLSVERARLSVRWRYLWAAIFRYGRS